MRQFVRGIPFRVVQKLNEVNEVPKGIELIQAPKIWKDTKGKGIKIAVVDTGCDINHLDLKDRIIGGRNFTDDDQGNPEIFQDYNGHGTHVSGTIAATENNIGVVGVAPEASLLVVKVLNRHGVGQHDWIINGIKYAIEQNVDIISMSLGGPDNNPELYRVIKQAVSENILVVWAAGNEGDGNEITDEFAYPGRYNEVICVGAVNFDRRSSDFTSSHNEVDLVAPGEEILSTYLDGKYATLSGTSMATPHVTGALALVKVMANQYFERQLSEPELYAQLIKRTIPLGFSPKLVGNGILYLTVPEHLAKVFDQEFAATILKACAGGVSLKI